MPIFVGDCLLKELLTKRGMTQTELADKLGVKPQQVQHYIQNTRTMSLKTAKNVAHILNCNIEDLYEWIYVK